MDKAPASFDWERLLAHAAILQAKVPSAVLVVVAFAESSSLVKSMVSMPG